jgi:hypothetical protein
MTEAKRQSDNYVLQKSRDKKHMSISPHTRKNVKLLQICKEVVIRLLESFSSDYESEYEIRQAKSMLYAYAIAKKS